MKSIKIIIILAFILTNSNLIKSQILSKKELSIDFFKRELKNEKTNYLSFLKKVRVYDITYLSDGLRVKGFLVKPKQKGKFPCVIYNRGGNRNFGAISYSKVARILARISSWGYVVLASQYRGNMGGEGEEEFGGRDVNDVLNLFPIIDSSPQIDSTKVGIFGWSRGGMMSYLVLKKIKRIKAAVIGGGLSNLFLMKSSRPEMEDVYKELIPNYENNKTRALIERSAIKWADKIYKKTPILILHGTSDWRVIPQMSLDLAKEFIKFKQPFRLIMFEGGDHGLTEFDNEVFSYTKTWFDDYLKRDKALPNLKPHGK